MKKLLLIFLALLLISCSFAGCGNNSPLDPKSPVVLNMWHNYGGDMQSTMDYLIDKFNATVGKEEGIVIDVTAISSSSELNKSLGMIANEDPGAPAMPDIFTGYPKVALQFIEKDMLVNLDEYFTEEELSEYVDAFVEEGRISDGGLYVFPIAKSTEVLYLNRTLFDEFSAETGAEIEKLSTAEGIAELSVLYYEWSGGKQFYTADSWFNFVEVGMEQLGTSLFDGEKISPNGKEFEHIFETIYTPAVEGGIIICDGYSSDLAKTGDIVCSTGSSAGILFYGDTITYDDGTVIDVEYDILPYPVFEGGEKIALQRGGGLMVAKSDEQREYAASVFVKWLSQPEQNMDFVANTGYLPVTKQAFEVDVAAHIETVEDIRIRKMLESILSMYGEYSFFTAPNYSAFDAESDEFEEDFKKLLIDERDKYLSGKTFYEEEALSEFAG